MSKSRKTIAVNTRFLLKDKLEGIGRFTCESLQRITKQHPEHDFVFLFDRPYDERFIFSDNVRPMVLYPPARHPLLWYAWFEYAVPFALRKIKADLFLSTDGYCSLSTKVPSVMVMHDLAFEHFPEQVSYFVRKYYKCFSPKFAHKADRVAAVSKYTKKDIVDLYGISPNKIDVVYNGVNNSTYAPLDEFKRGEVKKRFAKGEDYYLFVGAIHPRKNLANILRAFEQIKNEGNNNNKLLVAGRKAWQSAEAFNVYEQMQFKEDVVFLGHLQQSDLADVLGGASALVYASFFEGFGIPIIEAMQCDTPVITSDASSMPEVAGEGAILVNPHSVNSIKNAMHIVYHNKKVRNKLITAARHQRQQFCWDKTATNLWRTTERVLFKHKDAPHGRKIVWQASPI